MKALILAAGYGTRLYPITVNKPKSLLVVKNKPVIEYIIKQLESIKDIDGIFIVTNQRFFKDFQIWLSGFKRKLRIEILNDHTTSDSNRLGATGDMEFAIRDKNIQDDLLIIGGDNLFSTDLSDFINFCHSKIPFSSVGLVDIKEIKLAKKYGVVELDKDFRIINFIEKPNSPESTLVAKCLYFFPKSKFKYISEYLDSGMAKDAPGFFWEWFCKRDTVYGFEFKEPWFDIGDRALYKKAQKEFSG